MLDQPLSHQANAVTSEVGENDFHSGFSREGYMQAVERAREYIRAGDIMQVVLSQRMSIPYEAAAAGSISRPAYTEPVTVYVFYESW